MRSKSVNFNLHRNILFTISVFLTFTLNNSESHAVDQGLLPSETEQQTCGLKISQEAHCHKKPILGVSQKRLANLNLPSNSSSNFLITDNLIASNLPVLPETTNLVKKFEGFRSSAYIDSSGLPVIGYGQTRINGQTVRLGQYISQAQADIALEKELIQIQKLVQTHVKVELNPYQLGALTSLVYNAGTVVIRNSTLARKLNAGDYIGASQEFVRWNKANRGGKLVVFPGLTKRRLAEQQLFLTPYDQLASNQ